MRILASLLVVAVVCGFPGCSSSQRLSVAHASQQSTEAAGQATGGSPGTDSATSKERIEKIREMLMDTIRNYQPPPPENAPQLPVNIVGRLVGRLGFSSTGGFFGNWADGSGLLLPKVTDPNEKVYAFQFDADGRYRFEFGQGGEVWTSHLGRYSVTRATDKGSRKFPYLLHLMPLPASFKTTMRVTDPVGIGELERGPRTFRLIEDSTGEFKLMDVSLGDFVNDIGLFRIIRVR